MDAGEEEARSAYVKSTSELDVELSKPVFFVNSQGDVEKIHAILRDLRIADSDVKTEPASASIFKLTFKATALRGDKLKRFEDALKKGKCECISDGIVPWFPRKIAELDITASRVLSAGAELESDHPGFKDPNYRKRRREFAEKANSYKHGEPIPKMAYNEVERGVWSTVFNKLSQLYPTHACREHNDAFKRMIERCDYKNDDLPQLETISQYLRSTTGVRLRPVAGLLSSRDFLAGLAFKVFHSTQYIRHHANPEYTPEPDVCHELLGHAPLFANQDFADFSQEIGLASLGASETFIEKLATLYWFTIEFGLCKQDGNYKAYGAGLLSSFGELKYSIEDAGPPDRKGFDCEEASTTWYPITRYQPIYFVTESFKDAIQKMRKYAKTSGRAFTIKYNKEAESVEAVKI
ncbi:phenylalanine-4-hydroxylase-like [Oscarella lobularis]|uniref:phenylalanine-4-hydroxylase-like n=1 Tax=Oscarella lobularis TaxID=121494 RepID=UPI00331373A6